MRPARKNHECGLERDRAAAFLALRFGVQESEFRLEITPMRGGLCSTVAGVRVRFADPNRRPAALVVKRVEGADLREVTAYETLLAGAAIPFAPRLLGVDRAPSGRAYLFLERVNSWRSWPWRDSSVTALVLERLAHAHATLPAAAYAGPLVAWDYEADLAASAASTLEFFESAACRADFAGLRRLLRPLRRQVAALSRIRRQLGGGMHAAVVLHGDAHPGNVIVRRRGRSIEPVLIDWARARLGSPLEDVCSWLQSLACWEPEARRRHDTLFRRYLAARGLSTLLGPSLRELYWLAGSSNALAGAFRYHLLRMADESKPRLVRQRAAALARDWGRILVRADACWRA